MSHGVNCDKLLVNYPAVYQALATVLSFAQMAAGFPTTCSRIHTCSPISSRCRTPIHNLSRYAEEPCDESTSKGEGQRGVQGGAKNEHQWLIGTCRSRVVLQQVFGTMPPEDVTMESVKRMRASRILVTKSYPRRVGLY